MQEHGMRCIKCILVVFNAVFLLWGVVLVVVGALAFVFFQKYAEFLSGKLITVPCVAITVGCVTFFISLLGCCGSLKENYSVLIAFGSLLFLILLLEIAGVATAYVYREPLEKYVKEEMHDTLSKGKGAITQFWDKLQSNWKCCGVEGVIDYYRDKKLAPASCCAHGIMCADEDIYDVGCYNTLRSYFKHKIIAVVGIAISICVFEIIVLVLACCLAQSIRNSPTKLFRTKKSLS